MRQLWPSLAIMLVITGLWLTMATTTSASVAALNLSNTSDDSRNPALAVAANGSRHVVWEENENTPGGLPLTYLLHRTWNGVSWSPVITVSTGSRPSLAIGPDSMAHLVWTDEFSGTLQIFYSQWNGTNWSLPRIIAPGLSGEAASPVVLVDALNTVRVAWGQFQSGNYQVYYAQSPSGGIGAWTVGPVPNAMGTAPRMVLDGANTLHLAWQESVAGSRDIFYAQLSGAAWSLPENVSQSAGADSLTPSIALTPDNRPLVVWSETVGSQADIESSIRGASIWASPLNLSNSAAVSSQPRLTRVQAEMLVVWNESTSPSSLAYAFGNAGLWTPAKSLVAGGGDWSDVVVVAGNDGLIHVAYDGGTGANGEIFYDSFSLFRSYLPIVVNN